MSGMATEPDALSASGYAAVIASGDPCFYCDIGKYGQYPTFGKLIEVNVNGTLQWQFDTSSAMTADAIVANSPDASLTDPDTLTTYGNEACPKTAAAYNNGSPITIHECALITYIGVLPYSGDIVATLYASGTNPSAGGGGLMVLDPNGHLLASWMYPAVADGTDYWGDTHVSVLPKFVSVEPSTTADPSETANSEHFILNNDTGGCKPGQSGKACNLNYSTVQEFSFNPSTVGTSTNPIQPISGAVTASDIDNNNPAAPVYGGLSPTSYDKWGELWSAEDSSANCGGLCGGSYLEMFNQSQLSTSCGVLNNLYSSATSHYGYPCTTTAHVSENLPGTSHSIGWVAQVQCDCGSGGTGDILATSWFPGNGYVMPIAHGSGNPPAASSVELDAGDRGRGLLPQDRWLERTALRRCR